LAIELPHFGLNAAFAFPLQTERKKNVRKARERERDKRRWD